MGIFYERGVHYIILLKDGRRVTLLNSKDTDDRPILCDYYNQQKETWFEHHIPHCIALPQAPITLTLEEEQKIASALKVYDDKVSSHGWYDVITMYDTYGL